MDDSKQQQEFALAKPISPFSSFVSSTISSFGSFFGLAAPSSKAANAAATALSASAVAANTLLSQPAGNVSFDFDGDGKADVARWHRANAEWKVRQSSNGSYLTALLGANGAVITPGDFDGDGKTDFAVYKNQVWTIKNSLSGTTQTVTFGQAGDKPVVGDFDGDGKADIATFRNSTATWTIQNSSNNTTTTVQFGSSGDLPVAGNYDGDNRADIAVYRPSTGYWYVQGSTSGFSATQWGNTTDIPVPADYDGDGKTDKAVFRSSTGYWYILRSSDGGINAPAWGNYSDQPVPADYDGDGKADLAVWRPTTGVWHLYLSANSAYQTYILGVQDDTAVPSAYLKQIGGMVYTYDFSQTRLSPKNATGDTDLYSSNFSWAAGLVGLPGRAGMDLGLGISYNSLIWTRDGSTMVFDADKSNVAPGFRFGFQTIEAPYLDAVTGKYNYLMITPSGARIEFKQSAALNIYETADSSYTQLKVNGSGNPSGAVEDLPITVTGTDGTQMTYVWTAGAYRCTQIKDANGNYITIYTDEYGLLRTITDTLGRVINVNYDADSNPISITQNRQASNGWGAAQTYTYATFNYAGKPINTSFGGTITSVYGPQGVYVKALQSITFPGGRSTSFDYNSYGQVYKVSNYAADSHLLNYTQTNLDSPTAGAECPRFTVTRSWVENFNNGAETVVHNDTSPSQTYNVGGTSITATKVEVSLDGEPNNHVSKIYFGSSGWKEGLPLATEDFAIENGSNGQRRWTTTSWTQDNTAVSYILNPRITESRVGDAINTKKTTIDYVTNSGFTLPAQVKVYDANQSTVLKTSITDYNWSSAYISRRIIGLPSESRVSGLDKTDGVFKLVSKVTYVYDGDNFTDTTLNQNLSSVIQHDNTNYGAGFVIGRGNLTSTTRCDAAISSDTVCGGGITSQFKYNTAGAMVSQITPGSTIGSTRQVKIGYTDSFNDNLNRNTFAYPTTLTDPAGFSSQVKYRYDIGANVWAKSPNLNANTPGKETTREFDIIGRLERQTVVNNGAYTRYEYPTNGVQSKAFATITAGMGEAQSESWTDGAGRVRQSRTELPNSTGTVGWSGQKTEYDILGQVYRQTAPTEVDSNWNPSGDDYRGADVWLWTKTKYDWKGRVKEIINSDSISDGADGKNQLFSYDGCGCAGGQITTLKGEEVPRDDVPNTNGRRTQRIYADILGRTWKTEVLNWNGTTPYTTSINTFNGRDQVTNITQTENSTSISQTTTMSYDGHGRLKTEHRPEQNAGVVTTYNYNQDDSIYSVVDARGATANYTYNTRGLVEGVGYTAPSGITVPTGISYSYDSAGNRISMQDGLGSTGYGYDQLSRLTSETRTFNDSATGFNQSYTFNYGYNLAGQLTAFSDPNDAQRNVSYPRDKIGRVSSVDGNGFANAYSYANGFQYRAFGSLKQMTFGSGKQMTNQYNNRLQLSQFDINQTLGSTNEYYADGRIKKASDLYDNHFDRLYKYDQAGRVTAAKSGIEARDETQMSDDRPYNQTYGYNAFGDLTARAGRVWSVEAAGFTATYTNGKRQEINWEYDADGRQTKAGTLQTFRDATGRSYKTTSPITISGVQRTLTIEQGFDGDNQRIKQYQNNGSVTTNKYFVKSTLLGVVYEVTNANGSWIKSSGFVYLNGEIIAYQTQNSSGTKTVSYNYKNPVTGSQRGVGATEIDPFGADMGLTAPPQPDESGSYSDSSISDVILPHRYVDPTDFSNNCYWGGLPVSCENVPELAQNIAQSGQARPSEFTYGDTWNDNSRRRGGNGFWYHTWGKVDVLSNDGQTVEQEGEWGVTGVFWQDIVNWGNALATTPQSEAKPTLMKGVGNNVGGGSGSGVLDGIQTVLDICGLVPGFGEVADGANALISLGRGDYIGTALSVGAMIPFAGWGATAGKFGRTAARGLWKVTKEGTDKVLVHSTFGTISRHSSTGLWWSKDLAGHGNSAWKVFREEKNALTHIADADVFGDFIKGKHKGPVGACIPKSQLRGR